MPLTEAVADLVEREAELPKRADLLQAAEVFGRIQTVPRLRPLRWRQQADLLVPVQRPDGNTGPLGQLAYTPEAGAHRETSSKVDVRAHERQGRTSRYVRGKKYLTASAAQRL